VRYIKLTRVGFRAHVKIASRIVSYVSYRGSVRLWRHCSALCRPKLISGFVYDIIVTCIVSRAVLANKELVF